MCLKGTWQMVVTVDSGEDSCDLRKSIGVVRSLDRAEFEIVCEMLDNMLMLIIILAAIIQIPGGK